MAVLKNRTQGNFTIVSQQIVRDQSLSIAERGMLLTLLSLPDNWKLSLPGLCQILPDGRDRISNTINSLIAKGYITRNQNRNGKGRFGDCDLEIHEQPITFPEQRQIPDDDPSTPSERLPHTENPYTDKPNADTRNTDNPSQYSNNNITSIRQKKSNRVCKPDTLSDREYEDLIQEFDKGLVDYLLNRIDERNYKGCRNYNTIRRWCQERVNRKSAPPSTYDKPNSFHEYPQRTDYDYDALERQLISNL